jgi:hypothetical protein
MGSILLCIFMRVVMKIMFWHNKYHDLFFQFCDNVEMVIIYKMI